VIIAMGEMPGFQLGVIGALALSVASSVAIVICNKALISTLDFPFGISLSLSLSLGDTVHPLRDTVHPTQLILSDSRHNTPTQSLFVDHGCNTGLAKCEPT
jgi:hypothetical protein